MAFLVLTPAQGARLRNRIGDTDTSSPELSDTVLDDIYTSAGSDLDKATVYALQELIGIYAMQVDIPGSSSMVDELRSQRFDHLMNKVLPYWEKKTGLSGGKLEAGTLDYNIDTDADDLDLT